MSTRSLIGFQTKDVKPVIIFIYCHSDGYPSGVGKTLLTHYNSLNLAFDLVELGSISSLEDNVDDLKVNGDSFECYSIEEFKSVDMGSEYKYLFVNNKWHVAASNSKLSFKELTEEDCK